MYKRREKIVEETPKLIQELEKLKTELLSNNTSNVIANKKGTI